MIFLRVFFFAACLTGSSVAQAQVYKCKSASGTVEYSQTPCGRLSEAVQQIQTQPATSGFHSGEGGNHYDQQLRAHIAGALGEGDYTKARRLAVTEEHHSMVTSAERAAVAAKQAAAAEKRARRPINCTTFTSNTAYNSLSHTTCR